MTIDKMSLKQKQQALLRLRTLLQTYNARYWELLKAIQQQGTCDHAAPELYKWTHDDGYGRQSKMVGQRCLYCDARDYWNDGRWSLPDD